MKRPPIFTGKGDSGYTYADSQNKVRLSKNSGLIKMFGKIDTLQAGLDAAIFEASEEDKKTLEVIQEKLWQLYPATFRESDRQFTTTVNNSDLNELQNMIFETVEDVPNYFTRFFTRRGILLNECRVRCREAETYAFPLIKKNKIEPIVGSYLNRLSSFFYAMARKAETGKA